jgi:hypothetical protein
VSRAPESSLLHAGAAGVGADAALAVGIRWKHLGQDREHLLAQLRGHVDVLQAPQDLRDVIAGFGIEPNRGDVLLTELQLGIDDLTHRGSNDEVYEGLFARHRAIHLTARTEASRQRRINALRPPIHDSGTIGGLAKLNLPP